MRSAVRVRRWWRRWVSRLEKAFVQEQQRRARDEGAREGEALLFAAGEAFGFALRFVFQTDVAQGLHGLFFDFGFGQTAHFEAETDVVEGG